MLFKTKITSVFEEVCYCVWTSQTSFLHFLQQVYIQTGNIISQICDIQSFNKSLSGEKISALCMYLLY